MSVVRVRSSELPSTDLLSRGAYTSESRPSVTFNSRGSLNLGSYSSLPRKRTSKSKRMRRKYNLSVLTGKSPKRFPRLNVNRPNNRLPLLMCNKRLPDKLKNVELKVPGMENDNWRTDDIQMNFLALKIKNRRTKNLQQLRAMIDLYDPDGPGKSVQYGPYTPGSIINDPMSRGTLGSSGMHGIYTPGRTPESLGQDWDGFRGSMSGSYFGAESNENVSTTVPSLPLDFSLPSGLRPEYHISSPSFVGIHPWATTTSAAFLPSPINTMVKKRERKTNGMLYTPGFQAESNEQRLGAFYTRSGRSRGWTRRVHTPITPSAPSAPVTPPFTAGPSSQHGIMTTVLTEDDSFDGSRGFFMDKTTHSNVIDIPLEIRRLKSGKTGLFDGDDQILPVQSSDASSYKWGMM